MGNIKFIDAVTTKKKSLIFTSTIEDIIINTPDTSGVLATDNKAKEILENMVGGTGNLDFIMKPDITENNGGYVTSNWDGYLKIASYVTNSCFIGKHTGTEWNIYSDANCTNLIDRTRDINNRIKFSPNCPNVNTKYYGKYRFKSGNIYSPWSDVIEFTSLPGGIRPFDITIEENTLQPFIYVSGYGVFGDATGANHISTSWELKDITTNTVLITKPNDTTDKLKLKVPIGVLKSDTTYEVTVVLNTDSTVYPTSKVTFKRFTTSNSYIRRPILRYEQSDNKQLVIADEFFTNASSEHHTHTIWKIVNVKTNLVLYSATVAANTSMYLDSYISSYGKYKITCRYVSENLTSDEGILNLSIEGSKVDTINASFDTVNYLPKLKLSKFKLLNTDTDVIRSTMLMTDHRDHHNEQLVTWYNDLYNVDMEHTFTVEEFENIVDVNKVWDNSKIKLAGYVIGNKYNSEIFKAEYTPNISYEALVEHVGNEFSDLKLVIKDKPGNHNPDWVNVTKYIVRNAKLGTPIESTVTNIPIPNNGYEYGINHIFSIQAKTNIGIFNLPNYTVNLEPIRIKPSAITVTENHSSKNFCNLKIALDSYHYNGVKDNTTKLKEVEYKVYDAEDNTLLVTKILNASPAESNALTFNWNYIKTTPGNYASYGKKYRIEVVLRNMLGEQGKKNITVFTTSAESPVKITKPELKMEFKSNSTVELTITNTIAITGVPSGTHYATNWYIKDSSGTIIYQSLNNTSNLKTLIVNNTAITGLAYGMSYTVEAEVITMEGTVSEPGKKRVFYPLPASNVNTLIPKFTQKGVDTLNWRFESVYQVAVKALPFFTNGKILTLDEVKQCIPINNTVADSVASGFNIKKLVFRYLTDVRKPGSTENAKLGTIVTIDFTGDTNKVLINTKELDVTNTIDPYSSSLTVTDWETINSLSNEEDITNYTGSYKFWVESTGSDWILKIKLILLDKEYQKKSTTVYPFRIDKTYSIDADLYYTDENYVTSSKYDKILISSINATITSGPKWLFGLSTFDYCVNNTLPLTGTHASGYKVSYSNSYRTKSSNNYGPTYLEQMRKTGDKFVMILNYDWFTYKPSGTAVKIPADEVNLINQANPNIGLLTSVYKFVDKYNKGDLVYSSNKAFVCTTYYSNMLDMLGEPKTVVPDTDNVLTANTLYYARVEFIPFNNNDYVNRWWVEKPFRTTS